MCSSKAMRKARVKKDKETPQAINQPSDNPDELAAATATPQPTPTQHHHGAHDEGIFDMVVKSKSKTKTKQK